MPSSLIFATLARLMHLSYREARKCNEGVMPKRKQRHHHNENKNNENLHQNHELA